MKRDISAQDQLRRIYPEEGRAKEFSREVTLCGSHRCSLRCTYCYQHLKENKDMSWETAKQIIDNLFKMYDEDKEGAFITKKTKQIILDFIGGEPLLFIDLMEKVCDYFWSECIRRNHEWTKTFMISMASNGTEYFKPECQNFFRKYKNHLSYSVSIDGPQEMHDACRVFPDGSGSFKYAYAAQQDYNKNFYNSIGTKATIARANLPYLSRLIEYYVNEGFESIHANCVYEEQWNYEDAKLFYSELKKTADYLLSLDKEVELSLFDDNLFKFLDEEDNNNWCGGTGAMLGYDVDGKAYPCVRYMPASIGDISDKFVIGSAENGIYNDEKSKALLEELDNITRRSQSTDECFYCPIASGCSWCLRYDTLVDTPLGVKLISDLHVGDKICADDSSIQEVLSISCRHCDDPIYFKTSSTFLYTTQLHPILTTKGYVLAKDLYIGDKVILGDNSLDTIIEITDNSKVGYDVFDIKVSNREAFIANNIKVHNCSAWNAQLFGTPNKRCTRICAMHKARSLANVYYWNKKYLNSSTSKYFHRYLPDREALKIISLEELEELDRLEYLCKSSEAVCSNQLLISEEKIKKYLALYEQSINQNFLVEQELQSESKALSQRNTEQCI